MLRAARVLALLGLTVASCVGRGYFTDGTSVALGRADRGVLRSGRALALTGEGFLVPPLWAARNTRFGTDELVSAIERAAARVACEHPGALLGVGDLSQRGGGNMPFHRSHENGRDADLLFYSVDAEGAPLAPADAMPRYRGHKLRAHPPYEDLGHPIGRRFFDAERNWALVAALLEDPEIDVEYLFVSQEIRERLIDEARSVGAPSATLLAAEYALKQPSGFPPHDDHLHLRVRCSAADRALGCVDEGRVRLRSEIQRACGGGVRPEREDALASRNG
jgi:penicillin-insensitive murein endopeptidase